MLFSVATTEKKTEAKRNDIHFIWLDVWKEEVNENDIRK